MTRDAQMIKRLRAAQQKVRVAERYLRLASAELRRATVAALTPEPKPDGDGERKAA